MPTHHLKTKKSQGIMIALSISFLYYLLSSFRAIAFDDINDIKLYNLEILHDNFLGDSLLTCIDIDSIQYNILFLAAWIVNLLIATRVLIRLKNERWTKIGTI